MFKVKSHNYNTKEVRRIETNSIKAVSILVDSKSRTILQSESHHRDTKGGGEKNPNDQYHKINKLHKPGPEKKKKKDTKRNYSD